MTKVTELPRVGQYVWVSRDKVRTFETTGGERRFRVLVYGAYDAYGLIGPEHNGIAVMDEDKLQVVTDRLEPSGSGYYGPTNRQLDLFNDICAMTWPEFRQLVNCSQNLRHQLEE